MAADDFEPRQPSRTGILGLSRRSMEKIRLPDAGGWRRPAAIIRSIHHTHIVDHSSRSKKPSRCSPRPAGAPRVLVTAGPGPFRSEVDAPLLFRREVTVMVAETLGSGDQAASGVLVQADGDEITHPRESSRSVGHPQPCTSMAVQDPGVDAICRRCRFAI